MQNIDGAYGMARQNILENIATSADMPAILLKQETSRKASARAQRTPSSSPATSIAIAGS